MTAEERELEYETEPYRKMMKEHIELGLSDPRPYKIQLINLVIMNFDTEKERDDMAITYPNDKILRLFKK